MKTPREIENRIKFLLMHELDARISLACARLPHVCVHNYRHTLDVRKTTLGEPNEGYNSITRRGLPVVQTMGLCLLLGVDGTPVENPHSKDWGGTICEDPTDAQRCKYFTPKVTKDTLLTEFKGQLSSPDWLLENMPEVHSLLWVLGRSTAPKLPWWKRLWYHFLQINVEPLQPTPDIDRLLNP